jgi:hypothetical protein
MTDHLRIADQFSWIAENVPPIDAVFEVAAIRACVESGVADCSIRALHRRWNGDRTHPSLDE